MQTAYNFQSQGWHCQKGHLCFTSRPSPLTAPQTWLLFPKPQTSCPRLSRLQPGEGHLTLLAGALIPSRWAGGSHRGPSCRSKLSLVLLTMCGGV